MNDKNLQNLDSTDYEILKKLSEDCRKSFREIGRELEYSPTTVSKHVEELKEKNIINGFKVDIDYERLGYDIVALIELTISKGKMLEVEKDIAKIPNVYGVYDIVAKIEAESMGKLKDIVTWNIRRLNNVRSTLTMIVMEESS